MTPQPKSRTVGCWLILDDHGDTWRVQCLACNRKESFSRYLLGAIAPRCKCGGMSATTAILAPARPQIPPPAGFAPSKPEPADLPELDPILPFGPADNPVDKIATPPVADALFKVFGMAPVTLERTVLTPVVKPKPEPKPKAVKEPKPPKPSRQIHRTTVPLGPVAGTRLTVLGESETSGGRAMMRCRCECGVVKDVLRWHLAKGNIQSCGCAKDSPNQTGHNMRTVALPGDVFGSLVVVEEAPKQGKNRTVVCECLVCAKRWKVGVQNLRRSSDDCACADRWRQSSAGKEQAQEIKLARIAKRAEYDRVRKVRELERQIRGVTARLAKLQAQLDALTPAATVAQGAQ